MSVPRPGSPAEIPDEGMQSERTYLAWQRTGLSFAAVGALLVHVAGGLRHPIANAPGIIGLVTGAAILVRMILRYRSALAARRGERAAAAPWVVASVSATAVALCLHGLVLVFTGL